ncbi:MAG: alpha/beta fold hydrolase [Bacteroidaceae bacterium]|nr:alpha/beta fold hydrolase [Bacteroidaceae bacterium]
MEVRRFPTLVAALLLGMGVQAQSFVEREVEVQIVQEYDHDTMQLAGTLTMPQGVEGKVPAVILITGSGAQNRDEELMGHKPFKVIAEYLSARGYAVLRCDDRGVGGSTGDMAHATTLDFAQDVEHQLMYLQSPLSDLNIDPDRIFLFGHSEGATVAAIVAAKNRYTLNPVAGVAMLGGAGVDGKTLLLQQNEALFRLRGVADSLVERRLACMRELFNVCDTLHLGKDADTVKTINLAFRPLFKKHSEGLTKEQKQQIGLTSGECYGWALTAATPWMRTFLTLNPADYIAQMRCPLLAIGGEKDCQVPAVENLRAIADVCKRNNIPYNVTLLTGINHLGQMSETGSVDEYSTLGQAPDSIVLEALIQWLDSISSQSERAKN